MNITRANIWTHHRWKRSTCLKNSTKSKPRWRQDTVIVRGEHHKTYPIRIQQTSVRIRTGKNAKKKIPRGRQLKKNTNTAGGLGTHKTYTLLWSWCLSMFLLSKNGWCSASSWLSFDVVTAWCNQAGYIGYSYAKVKSPLFRAQSSIHRQILDMTWLGQNSKRHLDFLPPQKRTTTKQHTHRHHHHHHRCHHHHPCQPLLV